MAHSFSFVVPNGKEKRKELFVISGQNPHAALLNWSSALAGGARLAGLQPHSSLLLWNCSLWISLIYCHWLTAKREEWQLKMILTLTECDVSSVKNYLITDKSCSCIHLVKPWFYEEGKFAVVLFLSFCDSVLLREAKDQWGQHSEGSLPVPLC